MRWIPLVSLLTATLVAAGCGDDDDGASASDVAGTITVFAAASLTEAFTAIGDGFAAEFPDAEVSFNFASSSDLVTQINEGAPADVYASADQSNMAKLVDAGSNAGDPEVFAHNSLAIIVEPGNPEAIDGLADLADPDLVVVTCDPEVPIGRYTAEVLANAGVAVEPDSFEEDVKAVVNKVVLGEADAGVVYTTDVAAAGEDAARVEIPADVNVTAEYPLAVTADAPNPTTAAAFVDFVVGDGGQEFLRDFGFSSP